VTRGNGGPGEQPNLRLERTVSRGPGGGRSWQLGHAVGRWIAVPLLLAMVVLVLAVVLGAGIGLLIVTWKAIGMALSL
jgi:hypothetical protein